MFSQKIKRKKFTKFSDKFEIENNQSKAMLDSLWYAIFLLELESQNDCDHTNLF